MNAPILDTAAANMESDLRRERDYWRTVACYLADCHAATAEYDGSMKSLSKSRRDRYAAICEKANEALRGHLSGIHSGRSLEEATKRCADAAARLRATLP